mgnify:CR=1 FL=1
MARGGKLKQVGKRGKEWAKARAKLKTDALKSGKTTCVARLPGCWRYIQGFGHSMKRRKLGKWGSAERARNLSVAVPLCPVCDAALEALPAAELKRRIEELKGAA